ncbi:hypothetical protein GQ649_26315 [Rhodococcus sp. DSM 6344]|nr:hypothetical protein [Rhodococcus erythropolis]
MSTLYKIECDLFEDQTECWPDDLLLLPRAGIDTMLDILVEQIRRTMAVDPDFPTELLPKIRETMRIVPALEGDAANAYLAAEWVAAHTNNDLKRACECDVWQNVLDLEGE